MITKVIFNGASPEQISWGGNDDPNVVLKVGETYNVEDIEVHSWHTKIKLLGIEGKFNDTSFTYTEPGAKDEAILAWRRQRYAR